jgi:hypothetical protein
VPGTSNHGWGLAVDLCGGIQTYNTPQYAWMVANAGRFGYLHPTWADPGNGREEPWHWEYAGSCSDGHGKCRWPLLPCGTTHGGEDMLIDCDTCTARGTGCADCVVTVLLGAPPGWQGSDPVVVPMTGRARSEPAAEDVVIPPPGVVVEFDEVERRAVRALADVGLVPPLRHRGQTG